MLLLSFLFTLIIIIAFAYTILIIFKQKKLSEIKSDFINNMTHEFKTPIATISLAVDSINNPKVYDNKDKVQYYTGIIKEENNRMNQQVEQVLNMSLLDKVDVTLHLEMTNVHELIQNAVEKINLQVEQKNGFILEELEASKHIILADPVHISNIIFNLLDNANKYSPEHPQIVISTKNSDKGIRIFVEDKGIGMSKETQKKIFEKFYRVPSGNLHEVRGFGLGLSYVKKLVEAHHGTISVQSELKAGSKFEIFLPFEQ
jgi:signal transduction histidine kinase